MSAVFSYSQVKGKLFRAKKSQGFVIPFPLPIGWSTSWLIRSLYGVLQLCKTNPFCGWKNWLGQWANISAKIGKAWGELNCKTSSRKTGITWLDRGKDIQGSYQKLTTKFADFSLGKFQQVCTCMYLRMAQYEHSKCTSTLQVYVYVKNYRK